MGFDQSAHQKTVNAMEKEIRDYAKNIGISKKDIDHFFMRFQSLKIVGRNLPFHLLL